MMEVLAALNHDLGKYVAFQLRCLPEDAPLGELEEALRADVMQTRCSAQQTENALEVWQRLRVQIVGLEQDESHHLTSLQEFAALDAAAMGLAEVITVAKNGKLTLQQAQQGRDVALEVSAKVRAFVRAARTRRYDG
jgi:hypothetical protein